MKFIKLIQNSLALLLSMVVMSACTASKPAKVSCKGNIRPVNVSLQGSITNSDIVIKSSQVQGSWCKQFAFSLKDYQEYSPLFYYYIAHADKIVVRIKPPFISYTYEQTQSWLIKHGVAAPIYLIIEEDNKQNPQVILECIKY